MNGACCRVIVPARTVAARLPSGAAAGWLLRKTITCLLTFCDSWAASAGVIGAIATFGDAGAAVAATAATDCPATKAGTDIAAITSGMTLLLACARNAPPVMRPCMLPHPVGGRGQPRSGGSQPVVAGRPGPK